MSGVDIEVKVTGLAGVEKLTTDVSKLSQEFAKLDAETAKTSRKTKTVQEDFERMDKAWFANMTSFGSMSKRASGEIETYLVGSFARFATGVGAAITIFEAFKFGLSTFLGIISSGASTFASWIKLTADAGDRLVTLSASTGVSVETLGKLKFAASQSNVEFSALTTGMGQLAIRTQTTPAVFARLGVALRDTHGQARPLESILGDVSERISHLQGSGQRAAAAFLAFGKSGRELLPILTEGRKGIIELMEQAQKLGLIMSTEAALAADRFNDGVSALSQQLDAFKNRVAEGILPVFNTLFPVIEKVIGGLVAWANAHKTQIKEVVVWTIKFAADGIVAMTKLAQTIGTMAVAAVPFGAMTERGQRLLDTLKAMSDAARWFKIDINLALRELDREAPAEGMQKAEHATLGFGKALRIPLGIIPEMMANLHTFLGEVVRWNEITARRNNLEADYKTLIREGAAAQKQRNIDRMAETQKLEQEEEKRRADERKRAATDAARRAAEREREITAQSKAIASYAVGFGKALLKGGDAAEEALVNLLDDLTTKIAEWLASSVIRMFLSLFTGGATGGSGGIGGFIGGILGFAGGGVVRGGVPGRDSVIAALTPGERVLTVEQTKELDRITKNAGSDGPAYAAGGIVQPQPAAAAGGMTAEPAVNMHFFAPFTRQQFRAMYRDKVEPELSRMRRGRVIK